MVGCLVVQSARQFVGRPRAKSRGSASYYFSRAGPLSGPQKCLPALGPKPPVVLRPESHGPSLEIIGVCVPRTPAPM